MGTRGPIPNRTGDLSRERDANRDDRPPVTKGTLRNTEPWPADPDWSEFVQRVYGSLVTSGIADFYQDSDYAYAHIVMSELDTYRRKGTDRDGVPYPTHKPSGQMFQAIMSAVTSLGMTEGDRRRMRIELESPAEESDAEVLAIASYEDMLGVAK